MANKETDIIIEANNMQVELTDCVTFWSSIVGLPSSNNALVEYVNTVISSKQDLIYYIVNTEADKENIPNKKTGTIAFVKANRNLYLYFSEGTTQEWLVLVNNMSYYYTKAEVDNLVNNKVSKNADITGATKCKISYDSKGLVTGGSDLEASDIPDISETYATASQGAKADNAIQPSDNVSELNNDGDGTSPFATENYVDIHGGSIDIIKQNSNTLPITNKTVSFNSSIVTIVDWSS